MKPCGICDNCLQLTKKDMNDAEFSSISQHIEQALNTGPLNADDLLLQLKTVSKEKAWQVIEFLQAENKLVINEDGLIKKSK